MATTLMLATLSFFGSSEMKSMEERLAAMEASLATLQKCIVVSQARMCSVCGDMRHALQGPGEPHEAPDHCGVCGQHGYKHVLMLNNECESLLADTGMSFTAFDYRILDYATQPPTVTDDATFCKAREAVGWLAQVEPYWLSNATCKQLYQ